MPYWDHWGRLGSIGIHWNPLGSIGILWDPLGSIGIHWDTLNNLNHLYHHDHLDHPTIQPSNHFKEQGYIQKITTEDIILKTPESIETGNNKENDNSFILSEFKFFEEFLQEVFKVVRPPW